MILINYIQEVPLLDHMLLYDYTISLALRMDTGPSGSLVFSFVKASVTITQQLQIQISLHMHRLIWIYTGFQWPKIGSPAAVLK